jgi:hypothetical protein
MAKLHQKIFGQEKRRDWMTTARLPKFLSEREE